MHDLQLVGFTTDRRGLIFRTTAGARAESYIVPVTDELVALVRSLADADPEDGAPTTPAGEPAAAAERTAAGAPRAEPRAASQLSVREIQARLRAGEDVARVAREAGVDDAWIERFAPPVRAEQRRIVERALASHLERPRAGASVVPLRRAVGMALADKGIAFTAAAFDAAWSSRLIGHDRWAVEFRYRHRGKERTALWDFDATDGSLTTSDRTASQLGFVGADGHHDPDAGAVIDGVIGDPAATPIGTAPPPPRRRATTGQARTARTSGGGDAPAGGTAAAPAKAKAKAPSRKATPTKASPTRAAAKAPGVKKAAAKQSSVKKSSPKKAGATPASAKTTSAKTSSAKTSSAKKASASARATTTSAKTSSAKTSSAKKASATASASTSPTKAGPKRPTAAKDAGASTAPGATEPKQQAATERKQPAATAPERQTAPAATKKAAATRSAPTAPAPAGTPAPSKAAPAPAVPATPRRPADAAGSNGATRSATPATPPPSAPERPSPNGAPTGGRPVVRDTAGEGQVGRAPAPAPASPTSDARRRTVQVETRRGAVGPTPPIAAVAEDGEPANPDELLRVRARRVEERLSQDARAATGTPSRPAPGAHLAGDGRTDPPAVPRPWTAGAEPEADRTAARRARAAERNAHTVQFRSGAAAPVRVAGEGAPTPAAERTSAAPPPAPRPAPPADGTPPPATPPVDANGAARPRTRRRRQLRAR
ncbi:MAG TPA: septation protein SepH [Acidimicrobiales bacterium]|nr:septation protein SepH [Acidimicrobiales bacterium]